MRVLITGAGGMLGRDVAKAAGARGMEAVAMTREQLDVTDAAAVARAVRDAGPEVIVNCAAWTDVDGAETSEDTATAINGAGAGNVARAASGSGARVVQVSTDYVFNGQGRAPYVESDPVGPQSAYGRSKLAGERAVVEAGPEHVVARTSWLFGAAGKNFVDTMLRLGGERDEVRVVNDQIGCPTYTGHLADGLLDLAESGTSGAHHIAGAGACSWHGFATEIFRQAGLAVTVTPATTAEMARPAPRPAYSVLGCAREDCVRLPEWQEGLAAYLAERSVGATT